MKTSKKVTQAMTVIMEKDQKDYKKPEYALTPGYTSKQKESDNNRLNKMIEKFVACGGVIKKIAPAFNFRENDLYKSY